VKRFIYTFLLVTQMGIVVTGGAVRLTGSGLGCPTWPECTPGSYTPLPHQAQGQLHSWIEFGNRLLTFLLIIAIAAAIIGAIRWGRSRQDKRMIYLLAFTQFIGIVAQIIVGGISVLTHLNPFAVGAHFILSIVLIAATVSLRQRMLDVGRVTLQPLLHRWSTVVVVNSAIVIILGIFVTGSGPHAGDLMAKRFHLDPRTISWLHADTVISLIALSFGLWMALQLSTQSKNVVENEVENRYAKKKLGVFLAISVGQGAIGYTQYFTKLPEILVGFHLLGATMVWASIWNYAFVTHLFTSRKIYK
jgi:cytochrome c oxidase assembly protein subunit 15